MNQRRFNARWRLQFLGLFILPGLAALLTKRLFGEPIGQLAWKWGGARYAWLAYLIPLAYALPVYLITWLTPLGGFLEPGFLNRTAGQMGWSPFPSSVTSTITAIFC